MPRAYPMGAFFLSWSLPMTLLGKRPIISTVANPLFRMSACVVLVCALAAASMVPMLGQFAPVQFSHDFIAVAYTLGLARIALMIAAMDVGSAFEGMGAAREASFSAYAEPALFLLIGAAGAATGMTSFADLIGQLHHTPYFLIIVIPLVRDVDRYFCGHRAHGVPHAVGPVPA